MLFGSQWKLARTHLLTIPTNNLRDSSEPSLKAQVKSQLSKLNQYPQLHPSIQERNGLVVSTILETKHHAALAGLSVLQKLFQTDSVLLLVVALTLFFPHKTWSLATREITLATVGTSIDHGNTSNNMVLPLTNASHTLQAKEELNHAQLSVLMALLSRNTSARMALPFKPEELKPPSNSFKNQAQLKPDSPSMVTSSTTEVVSIPTLPVVLREVTP